jgi:hypothetical protein
VSADNTDAAREDDKDEDEDDATRVSFDSCDADRERVCVGRAEEVDATTAGGMPSVTSARCFS